MNRLRDRLILLFLAATLVPLGLTFWMTTSLLEHSLTYASTRELDEISKSLEQTAREFYHQARENLKNSIDAGRVEAQRHKAPFTGAMLEFAESREPERFLISGRDGDEIELLRKHGAEVWRFSQKLGGPGLNRVAAQYARAREIVEEARGRDLRRGFTYTYIALSAVIWFGALALLIYSAHRISRPIQDLTAGLQRVAAGDLDVRIANPRSDEVGRAIDAFHHMADEMKRSRERLVYLTRIASWQTLARKMAHEVKNSLTPIRLTMEEIGARFRDPFLEQASQIVVDEVGSLERRVRAFSEFAAEPPVRPEALAVNALVEERIALLGVAHPDVRYSVRLAEGLPPVMADADLLKGMLTNLLENAAHAAGANGVVQVATLAAAGNVAIEVHDSGPGLSEQVRQSLFEPTISFKKGGMGLGLSIARRSALLLGGDIVLVRGELGGAGFRITLPAE